MKKNISLAKKFRTAFLIIAVVPVLVFGIISYFQLQHAVTRHLKDLLTVSSQNKKIAIDNWLDFIEQQSRFLASLDDVQIHMTILINSPRFSVELDTAYAKIDRSFKSRLTNQSNFIGVYILGLSGKVIYSLVRDENRFAVNASEHIFFKNGLSKMFISDIIKSPLSDGEAILVSYPLRDAEQNTIAVMVFEVGLEHLFNIMSERSGMGETGEAFLVNNQGYIISKIKSAQMSILTKQSESIGVREALKGRTIVDEFPDVSRGNVLGSYIWYPRHQWAIVSEMHTTESDLFGWRLIYENILLVFLIALFIYFFSRFFAKRFSDPIVQLTNSAEVITAGDLREQVEIHSDTEIGKLGKAFNLMISSLASLNKKLHEMSVQIGSAAHEILTSSEEQEHISLQESSAVSETSATIEELSVSSKQVAQSAQSITQQVEGTARKIMFLSEKAQEINKITGVIEDIGQQIHLLSLNASIEAARAGEHGKGFEVVASEIRKLSEKANKQTSDISSIVQDIQDATSTAVLATEQAVNGVRAITLSIQQQEMATNQISIAMNEINLGMKQSIEGTKQTVQAVSSLNHITKTLTDELQKFKF